MQILDLIAKVSWETNAKDLKTLSTELNNQDKAIDELNRKGKRLADQMVKTNDPKKVKALNDELNRTKKSVENIVASQQKQVTVVEQLRKKQQEFYKELSKANDPKATQGLLRGLKDIEKQLGVLEKKSSDLPKKMSGIGQSLLSGFGIGAGMFALQNVFGAIGGFIESSIKEFESAELAASDLRQSLRAIGKEKYFDGLADEADKLSKAYFGLFDNDDIVLAQKNLVQYGRLSRAELSSLLPVILELAAAQRIGVVEASEKVVNILAGRGAATLREYGLSMKGAKTDAERLALVQNDLAAKLRGSADAYKDTAQGIAQTNATIMAGIEENFGRSFANIRMKVLPILTRMLNDVNKVAEEGFSFRQIASYANPLARAYYMYQNQRGAYDEAETVDFDAMLKRGNMAKGIMPNSDPSNLSNAETEEERMAREEREKSADAARKEAQKQAQALEEQRKANAKKLIEDLKQIDRDLAAAQLSADEKEINAVEEKYRKLLELAKQYGVDLKEVETRNSAELNLLYKKFAARDKAILDNKYQGQTESAKVFGSNEVEIINKFTKQKTDSNFGAYEKDQQLADERMQANQELMANTNQLASVVSGAMQTEISGIDRLIQAQQERVQVAMQSGNKSVEIEEKRLSELLKKREQYEKAQRLIDNTMIVANNAVAISAAIRSITQEGAKLGPVGIAAQVVAIAAGIGAGTLAIRDAVRAGEGFKDGGYTGDGDPSETSTALGKRGYKYHKKEFVMNEPLTAKHRDMFEKLHTGQLDVKRIGGAYFLAPQTLDVDAAVSDHNKVRLAMNLTGVENTLRSIDSRLQAREVNVVNTFDAEGFSTKIAAQLGQIHIKNKLANS